VGRIVGRARDGQALEEVGFLARRIRREERSRGVEERMLQPRRALDGGEDLIADAEQREGAERRVVLLPEVADRLEQADHRFLDDVFLVAADEEVIACVRTDQFAIAPEDGF
jgi:hypothetical protein